MRKPTIVTKSGPYKVKSLASGVLKVEPTWPQFPVWTEEDGGGPGMGSRMALAADLERWLNNQPTPSSEGK